jgi:hypothetical protein
MEFRVGLFWRHTCVVERKGHEAVHPHFDAGDVRLELAESALILLSLCSSAATWRSRPKLSSALAAAAVAAVQRQPGAATSAADFNGHSRRRGHIRETATRS